MSLPTELKDALKSLPLYVLPHHAISRVVYWLTRIRSPLKDPVIRWFVNRYGVNMSEALEPDIAEYPTFNAFFTRAIKPELRPIASGKPEIASPVDGTVSQAGRIESGVIFQAKGHDYTTVELLGGDEDLAARFDDGKFATLYLSPRDYHRIHMPVDGKLEQMIHVPGRLFSVAPHTVRAVPNLFARNERVVAIFDTAIGPMAMVLVGAINVAAIETVWSGLVTPCGKQVSRVQYGTKSKVALKRGAEMGRFNMGSTVILLFGNSALEWDERVAHGEPVRFGQLLGEVKE
jgi:phosphatidylserine decarboxylase